MDPVLTPLIEGQKLFGFVEAVLWTALRVGGVFMAGPLFGTRVVTGRVRLVFVLALSTVLAPLLPPPPVAAVDALTIVNVAREIALGIALGFVLRIAFEAAALAGELVSQGMGLSFAQLADPLRGGATSGVVGMWFYIAFTLLFLAFDAHLALLQLTVDSYRAVPIGGELPNPLALVNAPLQFFAYVLAAGVRIALPVMVAMLVVNLAFGVLGRAAPALNPIAVGLPAALLSGLFLLGVLMSELESPARALFDAAFREAAEILR